MTPPMMIVMMRRLRDGTFNCCGKWRGWHWRHISLSATLSCAQAQIQNLSDYFTGKTPFITAYVDLLLARMAHTQSFSGDIELVTFFEAFDVITFEDTGGRRKNYGVIAIQSPTPTGKICITHNIAKKDNEWVFLGSEKFGAREFNFRTITELEAVEFRKAMEAVYG